MRKIIFLMAMMFLSACARNEGISTIPPDMKATKLAEILKAPAEYQGKEVLLKGNFAGFCGSCPDEFHYKEGIGRIEVYTKGFLVPKIAMGTPLKVYGIIKVSGQKLYLQALAVEVLK